MSRVMESPNQVPSSKRQISSDSPHPDHVHHSVTSKRTKITSHDHDRSCDHHSIRAQSLGFDFYNQPCVTLAQSLLGKTLVRILDDGSRLSGKIVETEGYLGVEDTAAHSYQGRRTARNAAMFMSPGTSYVYLIYGMYSCLNVSSKGEGCCVLVRALQPLEGLKTMTTHRTKRCKETSKPLKPKDLCSGPGKLTEALHINKALLDKKDLTTDAKMWIESADCMDDAEIVACPRIGIEGTASSDWLTKPLRFYIKGNECVSKRDRNTERTTEPIP